MRLTAAAVAVVLAPGLLVLPAVGPPAAAATAVSPELQQVPLDGPDAVDDDALALLTDGSGRVPLPPVPTDASAAALAEDVQGTAMGSRDPVVLTAPRRTDEFHVAGVTWEAEDGVAGVAVSLRVHEDGAWGPWEALPVTDEGPDAGTPESSGARVGTGPLLTTGADGVQVRVDTADGGRPDGLRLDLVDAGSSAADATAGVAPAPATSASAAVRPAVVSRAQWGADESLAPGQRTVGSGVRALVLHHTAGSNSYTQAQAVQQVRGIYAYHTQSLDWDDIGYNLLVDRYGRVYEGRRGSTAGAVVGAHSGGFNTDTFGVAAMGSFDSVAPPQAAVDGVKAATAWVLGRYGVDPTGTSLLVSAGGGTARWSAGTAVRLPNVMGHRDVGQTACPGRYLYSRLGEIRSYAASATAGQTVEQRFSAFPRDRDGNRTPDLIAIDPAQRMWSYPGTGAGGFAARRQIGQGWGGTDLITQVGDLTGDGAPDVLARRPATGQLWLYPGNGTGGFAPARLLGAGWGSANALLGPGDFDGDGAVDLLARFEDGTLRLYPGTGRGGFAASRQVGNGWQSLSLLTAAGDLTADGRPDVVARTTSGDLLLYAGTGSGLRSAGQVGRGWGSVRSLVGLGNWDGRSGTDLLAVGSAGTMTLYRGGTGRILGATTVGKGWGGWRLVG